MEIALSPVKQKVVLQDILASTVTHNTLYKQDLLSLVLLFSLLFKSTLQNSHEVYPG